MFENHIFNELFKIFEIKNMLSKHQSAFRPGDSCMYQLLVIIYDIFLSFECSLWRLAFYSMMVLGKMDFNCKIFER